MMYYVYDIKDYDGNDDKFENDLILGVCKQLDVYIDEIKPNNQMFVHLMV